MLFCFFFFIFISFFTIICNCNCAHYIHNTQYNFHSLIHAILFVDISHCNNMKFFNIYIYSLSSSILSSSHSLCVRDPISHLLQFKYTLWNNTNTQMHHIVHVRRPIEIRFLNSPFIIQHLPAIVDISLHIWSTRFLWFFFLSLPFFSSCYHLFWPRIGTGLNDRRKYECRESLWNKRMREQFFIHSSMLSCYRRIETFR